MRRPSSKFLKKEGQRIWSVLSNTYNDFDHHNSLTYAGSLAFFFLLSVFPLMIFLATLLAFIPIPNLFDQSLDIMSKVVPADAMGVVRGVLHDVLQPNTELLSFSIISALFAASGGFASLITALNVAYDVKEGRPYWKKRLLAFGLTLLAGIMVAIVLAAIALGPEFGSWLADKINAAGLFFRLWPLFRWVVIVAFTILSVETIYFLGPNVKQQFKDHISGAVVAVVSWIAISWGLGWYLSSFAHYNRTFGALGAVIGLMLWFYVTAITLMIGAELNSELAKSRGKKLPAKEPAEDAKPPLQLPERTSRAKSA